MVVSKYNRGRRKTYSAGVSATPHGSRHASSALDIHISALMSNSLTYQHPCWNGENAVALHFLAERKANATSTRDAKTGVRGRRHVLHAKVASMNRLRI